MGWDGGTGEVVVVGEGRVEGRGWGVLEGREVRGLKSWGTNMGGRACVHSNTKQAQNKRMWAGKRVGGFSVGVPVSYYVLRKLQ